MQLNNLSIFAKIQIMKIKFILFLFAFGLSFNLLFSQNVASFSLGNTGISAQNANGIWQNPASLAQYNLNSIHIDALNLFYLF